jgi:hypothetical protein
MTRSPTKTDQRSKNPSTLAPSPFKAAKRAKRRLTNAGLGNVNEALRFHDLGARFANPFLALGPMSSAQATLADRQLVRAVGVNQDDELTSKTHGKMNRENFYPCNMYDLRSVFCLLETDQKRSRVSSQMSTISLCLITAPHEREGRVAASRWTSSR